MFHRSLILLGALCLSGSALATDVPIYDFSIKPYSQNVGDYLSPDSPGYAVSVLKPEYQKAQAKQFYNHYYSSSPEGLSPWSEQMVKATIPIVKNMELEVLGEFDNQNKPDASKHYGENFKEHDEQWLNSIKKNMDFAALDSMAFNPDHRAIAVVNTFSRALPESAPDFYHFSLPGQGFPFDNLEESVVWAGTPLYVLSVSQDKAWSLVLTPDEYFSWVKSSDIAYVSAQFMNHWQQAAEKGMAAITQTGVSVLTKEHQFQFTSYIGAVFPMVARNAKTSTILTPGKNTRNQAIILTSYVPQDAAEIMPLEASPKNMARILSQLQNRPYGWGGMFFFNDCSQEIKSIFTPFGIWMPRNSGQQGQMGTPVDLSKNTVDERLDILKEKGHPMMTVIYIKGHVMLYLGNKTTNNERMAITYQNLWGMSPPNKERRYIVGQSLFFPLLKSYPETPDVSSLAAKDRFVLVHLDELQDTNTPEKSAHHFMMPSIPEMSL